MTGALRESGIKGSLKGTPPAPPPAGPTPCPLGWGPPRAGAHSPSTSIQPRQRTQRQHFGTSSQGGWVEWRDPHPASKSKPHPCTTTPGGEWNDSHIESPTWDQETRRTTRPTGRETKTPRRKHQTAGSEEGGCKSGPNGSGGSKVCLLPPAVRPPTMLGYQLTGTPPAPAPLAVT